MGELHVLYQERWVEYNLSPAVHGVENISHSSLAKGGRLAHGDQAFHLGLRCGDGNDLGLGGKRPLSALLKGDQLEGGFEPESPSAAINASASRVLGSRSQSLQGELEGYLATCMI